MIPTPHIRAKKEDIAKVVIMPGDPLRAKFIAENYLEDYRQINDVRNMFGYTGTYKGKQVTVMGSGMGMASMGIYSYELFKFYDVDIIIRIGSAGAYTADLKVYDLVLAASAYSESTYGLAQDGSQENIKYPSLELNEKIIQTAESLNYPLTIARIHSSDVFYHLDGGTDFKKVATEQACVCVEMESFALFQNAKALGKQAACLLTISDSLVTHEVTSAEERQNSFTRMMDVALNCF